MNNKAFDILNSSINSAVFIDEKAKDFFSGTPIDDNVPEEKLSENLFRSFKDNGKSLVVHKFEIANLDNTQILDYLFNGKDLILLDWELADVAGQEYSLKLLNRAVTNPSINFCCIYSSSANFNSIPFFLDAYFSGITKDEFQLVKNAYGHIEADEIQKVIGVDVDKINAFFIENEIDIDNFPIEKLKNISSDMVLRFIYISLTLEKYNFSDEEVRYEVLNSGNDSFIINNTFVFTLKKDLNDDNDYLKLLKRISETVVKNDSCFFQLLGLEMQSIFNSNERFIDKNILKSSTEALFLFRNHLKDDKAFGTIIKKLLLEQATLKLRTAKLKLLDTEFLDTKSEELKSKVPSNDDIFNLNVFYNSVTVKSLHPESVPNLNFGDVFKDNLDNYYLCITALCDCYYPDKIEHNFYFAKGKEFKDVELALKLGDTAFLSFLPNNKVVHWGDVDKPKIKKIKQLILSESEDIQELKQDIQKLKDLIENLYGNQTSLNKFLYRPFYIKPKVYNVENNKLLNNRIRLWDITNISKQVESQQNLNYFDVEYISTLRDDYSQRIANHAFGHPIRVGIDFAKIS